MGARAQGIIGLVLATTILNYGRMALTDMLKGVQPRDPRDPRTMMAALLQGGGLGILGDFLFGEFSRQAQVGLWNLIKKETGISRATQNKDAVANAFETMLDNTPYVNLWYTRNVLNYLFIWRLQEAMSPGFQRRAERRLKERTGQTHWLSPAQLVQ